MQVGNPTFCCQSQHVCHNVGSCSKKIKKKRSAENKSLALKKYQDRDISFEKLLERLDNLPLPSHYKIKHLGSIPTWIKPVESVNLNSIYVDPMPFIPCSDVLLWNPENDDSYLDRCEQDKVKVIRINTTRFTSDELAEYANPPAICVPAFSESSSPSIDEIVPDPIDTEVQAVAVNPDLLIASDEICCQYNGGTDATVTNLLAYFHDYRAYTR